MKGTITKIDPPKLSNDRKNIFHRIYFTMEDGSWAHTDIVNHFRNFKYWQPIIRAGPETLVGNLKLKVGYKDKIDADCNPHILRRPVVEIDLIQRKLL